MKRGAPKTNLLFGSYAIFLYLLHQDYILLFGLGIFGIITGLFEMKNYYNNKLYLAVTGAILTISLILSYIQLSSPSYHGDMLLNYASIIFLIFLTIIGAYDFTHDYKFSKILQMKNVSPKVKNIIAIMLLFAGLITGLLIIYVYKI